MLRSVANARNQNRSVVSFTRSLTGLGLTILETGKNTEVTNDTKDKEKKQCITYQQT